ncbi:MAG: hypothetical protein G01um101429_930 [Parcubacteria group bacterium Gr01-1014_29]|nr:MAG: hypothetical protein G01um101429_930 [Parcubacteria group bacterium Gr01-1014_29]
MQEFNLTKASEMLILSLPKRSGVILEKRFGLGKTGSRHTLEAIGQKYGITRERVRQIERDAIGRIRKASVYNEVMPIFLSFRNYIIDNGGVMAEPVLLADFSNGNTSAHAVRFLLSLAPQLVFRGESDMWHPRWGIEHAKMDVVETSLTRVAEVLAHKNTTVSYDELSAYLREDLASQGVEKWDQPHVLAYLALSKMLGKNCFGQWGHASSPLVRPRGVRDLAYLVFQKEGTPMHFSLAATRIREVATPRRVHAQTVHNELIKDPRFVLVGRGTYGLVEWGYEPGTVRDIISRVLVTSPCDKDTIVSAVLAKRHVKENTILINLQNRKYFQKLNDGTYSNVI